jgi:hypothetical protein
MRKIGSVISLFLFVGMAYGQIVIQAEENLPNKDNQNDKKKEKSIDGSSSIRFGTNWSYTMRKLSENEAPYGDSLGNRATETNLNCWSFGLGVTNKLNAHLSWTGAIAYLKNGENYSFTEEALDSTFRSTTTYSYLALPLQLDFSFGKSVVFYAGVGVAPQILSRYKQDRSWKVGDSAEKEEIWKVKPDYGPNMFVLSFISHCGMQLNLDNTWGVFFEPQLRLQLTSTYQTQDSYIHKNRSYGFNFGILKYL